MPQQDSIPTKPIGQLKPLQQPVQDIHALAGQLAHTYGISPDFINQQIQQESSWNPKAQSPKGAQGLMQLMPPIQKQYGVTDPYDPKQNMDAGMRYFKSLLDHYKGDYQKAASHYNSGKPIPNNPETKAYVPKVTAGIPQKPVGKLKPLQQAQPAQGDTIRAAGPLEKAAQTVRSFSQYTLGHPALDPASQFLQSPLDIAQGAQQVGLGVGHRDIRHVAAGGAAQMAGGALSALAPVGLAAAPELFAPMMIAQAPVQAGVEKGLGKLGATPEEQRLGGAVIPLAALGAAGKFSEASEAGGAARGARESEALTSTLPAARQAKIRAKQEAQVPPSEQELQIAKMRSASGIPEKPVGKLRPLAPEQSIQGAPKEPSTTGAQVPGTSTGMTGATEVGTTKPPVSAPIEEKGPGLAHPKPTTIGPPEQVAANVGLLAKGLQQEKATQAAKIKVGEDFGKRLDQSSALMEGKQATSEPILPTSPAKASSVKSPEVEAQMRAGETPREDVSAKNARMGDELAAGLRAEASKMGEVSTTPKEPSKLPVEAPSKPVGESKVVQATTAPATAKPIPGDVIRNRGGMARRSVLSEKPLTDEPTPTTKLAKFSVSQRADEILKQATGPMTRKEAFAQAQKEAGIEPKPSYAESRFGKGKERGSFRVGGAKSPKDTLDKLTDSLEKLKDRPKEPSKFIDSFVNAGRKFAAGADHVTQTFVELASHAAAGIESLKKPPEFTDFPSSLGELTYQHQRAQYAIKDYVDAIRSKHPKGTLEALTNYLQAGGDEKILTERAASSKAQFKSGYEKALRLSPEEKQTASAIKDYFEWRFKEGQLHGIVNHGLENYVNQIWEKKGNVPKGLAAELNNGLLNKSFKFGMKRIFDSYFEGEQKGKTPKNKGIDFLVAAYDNSFNKAVASRKFVKQMMNGKAEDRRPLVIVSQASARRLLPEEIRDSPIAREILKANPELRAKLTEAYLINPHAKTAEEAAKFGDYIEKPYRAFEKYTWVTKGEDGKPVFMQGRALVHPDIGKGQLSKIDNIMGRSIFREWGPTKALMAGQSVVKQTLLGFSAFHYVQEGYHAIFHKINPFAADVMSGKELANAFRDPKLAEGMRHGLLLYDRDAASLFQEGVRGSALEKLPVVGAVIQKMNEHLFERYIPSLKARMYKEAVARNTSRYQGKYSRDQIAEITANQANAAFGQLNYTYLARNKSLQDLFRMVALAPDFLEARGRFVGQAVKAGGREQLMAAGLRGTLLQYMGVRALNMMLNQGNPIMQPRYAFSIKVKDKAYAVRSLPADLLHLAEDPDSFVFWRTSPAARASISIFAKQRKGLEYNWKDFIHDNVPIAAQGATARYVGSQVKDDSLSKYFLESIGIYSQKFQTAEESVRSQQRYQQYQERLRGQRTGGSSLRPRRPPKF